MNVLLIFFAIPLAVIVISIALEKLLDCPVLVSAIIFSILLLIAVFYTTTIFFILTVIYAIISFISAWLCKYFYKFICNLRKCNSNCNSEENNRTLNVNGRVRILDSSNNNQNNQNTQNSSGTFCGCYRRR